MSSTKFTSRATTGVLSQRQLNRSLLERQHLLKRSEMSTASALEHLVGMQSQVPKDPFLALWSRLEGFRTDHLSQMMLDRTAVRALLMRGTIHLVTADDCLKLRPVMQDLYERLFPQIATWAPNLEGMDMDALLASARTLMENEPLTVKALGARLSEIWPDRDPASMAHAARHLLPLVQVTPRGVWGTSHQATWTTVERWLDASLDTNADPKATILRYLAAFGPTTVADIQTWSRLKGLREHVEALRPQLQTFRNEKGQELFDVIDAPFPDPETPAPPRFLPVFDNVLLSHADRTRIVAEDHRKALSYSNGLFDSTFLVDGFVAGGWKIEQTKRYATLTISPFVSLSTGDQSALEEEGVRLLNFLVPDADLCDLRFVAPD